MPPRPRALAWLLGALVALSASALVLPLALHGAPTPPDAVEHLAIANAWVHGQGFVDPIQYYFYLPAPPPLPAFAVRAPLVPLLISLPVAWGLGEEALFLAHTAFAIAVVTGTYVLLLRLMSPLAAAAAALATTSTFAWMLVAVRPLTEVTGWLLFVSVIAVAGRVREGVRPALLCAVLTWLAWLARPNLGVLVAVVAVAIAFELGPRAALRLRALHVYLGGFGLLFLATRLAVVATTGLAPYAGYGIITEHVGGEPFAVYDKTYVGTLSFVAGHFGEIVSTIGERVGQLLASLFLAPGHNRLGWLLPIGLVHTALVGSRARFEQVLCVLASLAFALPVVANYAAFDPVRYPMFPLMAGLLASFMALDALAHRAAERWSVGRGQARVAFVIGCGVLFGLVALRAATVPLRGTPQGELPNDVGARLARLPALARVCPLLEPDARVATSEPWPLHRLCGNATVILPIDVDDAPALWSRFLDERAPAYVVERKGRHVPRAGLDEVGRAGRYVVYAVNDPAPTAAPWRAPPAPICAGGDPICEQRDGRLRLRARGASNSMAEQR